MLTVTSLLIAVFVVYLVSFRLYTKSTFPSISSSYYALESTKKGMGVLFTVFMWSVGVLIIGYTALLDSIWFFFSATGAFFTGTAARYYDRVTRPVHFIGASLIYLGGVMGTIFDLHTYLSLYLILVCTIIAVSLSKVIKNVLYWWEVAGFVSIILGILTNKLL